ncbi:sodium-coupled monocarboxylate transporter 1-like [Mya arenaria]|uniref:sodium-coupled monocarboxylate transporter 1-like n=1 Tax=Mya arenaria TaxID=6604 RepID=UPI0022E7CECA|nr:sodium-coupled monocarboxylate transporter 1-like [Mya arenaria]
MEAIRFHIADYVLMVIFLVICSGIGVFYGFFKKQRTTGDYLLAGRKMHLFPVALSLLVTYQSAISVMGITAEMYMYDTMMILVYFSVMSCNTIQALIIVPLVHPLKLTSAYEYFGRRFQSRSVQLFGTFMGMLQTLLYMAIVLLAPALALEAVAGIPLWLSVVVVGVIGTVYTSIGGMKTVIWTDVFQFVILYGGLIVILVMGTIKIGGVGVLGEKAYEGGRINFSEISFDPRVRHTWWGLVIGGTFNWLPNTCNQAAIQRISSMRTTREAKISCLLNVPLVVIYGAVLGYAGLLMYAYFTIEQCDPYLSGAISNNNQLIPYFVMRVFRNIPGLAGLFIVALFSGALSSLSSGINSMAANTIQDVLVNVLNDAQQYKKTFIAKISVLMYGTSAVALAYLAKSLQGPVTQIALTAMGGVGGPLVGIMFLGGTFPQANWIGALVGGIGGMAINIWIAIGSVMYGAKSPRSSPVSTSGCLGFNSSDVLFNGNGFLENGLTRLWNETDGNETFTLHTFMTGETSTTSTLSDDSHLAIYDVSYVYIGMIGTFVTFSLGLIISLLTGRDKKYPTQPEYIFPCLRRFWKMDVTHTEQKYHKIKHGTNAVRAETDEVPIKALSWMKELKEDEL